MCTISRRRTVLRGFALAGALTVSTSALGCMGFRGGELNETRPWPPAPEAVDSKPTIRISLAGKGTLNQKPVPTRAILTEAWLKGTRKTYLTSGLFSDVRAPGEASDLHAHVEVLDAARGSKALWWLTGFTLGVIPSAGTDDFTWTTTFTDAAGNVRGVIEKRESSTMWMQILLLFGMPFSTPASAAREAFEEMNRSTLLDALEKGYLKAGSPAVEGEER